MSRYFKAMREWIEGLLLVFFGLMVVVIILLFVVGIPIAVWKDLHQAPKPECVNSCPMR